MFDNNTIISLPKKTDSDSCSSYFSEIDNNFLKTDKEAKALLSHFSRQICEPNQFESNCVFVLLSFWSECDF